MVNEGDQKGREGVGWVGAEELLSEAERRSTEGGAGSGDSVFDGLRYEGKGLEECSRKAFEER